MKTVRDLMERLQKLIDEDESWLDAEVEASYSTQYGNTVLTAEMLNMLNLEPRTNTNYPGNPPTVCLTFSDADFSEFM